MLFMIQESRKVGGRTIIPWKEIPMPASRRAFLMAAPAALAATSASRDRYLLFSPGRIGSLELTNRLVRTATAENAWAGERLSEEGLRLYRGLAAGGAGLIISGYMAVMPGGRAGDLQTRLWDDAHIPAARGLARAVRETSRNCRVVAQIVHTGMQTQAAEPVGPTATPWPKLSTRPRALATGEVESIVAAFARSAGRAREAGFHGVELHAAHGYLIQQFLSPHTNRRTDEYGGSLENRMRLLLEIIEGVRDLCGNNFPIAVRLSVDEYYRCIDKPGQGIELAEGVEMARRLEQAGIDAIDVSSANYETLNYWLEPISYEPGWRNNLAKAVKEKVRIPVLAANLIRSADQAETQLKEGYQDFVCLGRPFLADAAWTQKVSQGCEQDIKRCISCLWCFESLLANALVGQPLECAVNPRLAREKETAEPLKNGAGRVVTIIGAGPAGLSAAEILGLRGFKPVILEKNAFVGGQLQLANKPPKKGKINWCFTDLYNAAVKNGAEVRFNTEATPEAVKALNPYAVIVATGGSSVVPPIEGVQQAHVCTVTEILNGSVTLKGKRVAVIGSGLTGLETAEKLAEDGNKITIVEMLSQIGPDAFVQHLDDILPRLRAYNVDFIIGQKLIKIKANSIVMANSSTGQQSEENMDYVVLSVGVKSNDKLARELQPHVERVYTIGDARKVGRIAQAVRDSFDTAWNL